MTRPTKRLAIVTPSYLPNAYRSRMARIAFRSLRAQTGSTFPTYVVDDSPMDVETTRGLMDRFRRYEAPASIYHGEGVRFTARGGHGMTSATRDAVAQAREDGAELIFIHLDDCVYLDTFPGLLRHAMDAMGHDDMLRYVRTGGYPLLSEKAKPRLGNRAYIQVHPHSVRFDDVRLTAQRLDGYTLWSSPFHERVNGGIFYPVPMWHAVYQADFLADLLELGTRLGKVRLGDLEMHFKMPDSWPAARACLSGRFGYINMQNGGFEIHRTSVWKKVHRYANEPIHAPEALA